MNITKLRARAHTAFLGAASRYLTGDKMFMATVKASTGLVCAPHLASKAQFKLTKGGDYGVAIVNWARSVKPEGRVEALILLRNNIANRFDLRV